LLIEGFVMTQMHTTDPLAGHRLGNDPVSAAARREVAVGRLTVTAVSDGVLLMSQEMVGSPAYPTGAYDEMDGDRDVIPGLRRLATPGHTPGHAVYVVEDDGQRLYLVGDSMHAPQQLAHPDWAVSFDVNPGQAREVREWLAAQATRPGTIGVLGCHFPGLLPVSI
jgi:glyoxylase-like metal-dependent hydrolase (beta-lactamase superfamily II)